MRVTVVEGLRNIMKVLQMEAHEGILGTASNLKLQRNSSKIHLNLRLLSFSMGSARW